MSPAADRGFLQFECGGRFAIPLDRRRSVRLQKNRTDGASEAVLLQFRHGTVAVLALRYQGSLGAAAVGRIAAGWVTNGRTVLSVHREVPLGGMLKA